MSWVFWISVGIYVLILIVNWIIVMGRDPKKWKGGTKDGKENEKWSNKR